MENIDFSTTIGKIKLQNPFLNASGSWCQEIDQLQDLSKSQSGAFICKSCTPLYREGNPPVRYWDNREMSINSMGLPNLGLETYLKLYDVVKYQKPYFMSIAGLSLEENLQMTQSYLSYHNRSTISGLEYNLSCPNIIGKGQLGYDFKATEEYLRRILETELSDVSKDELVIGVKLPPYFELTHFGEVSDIIKQYPRLDFVTCINSIANGLVVDTEKECPVIYPKSGFGGIGGNIVKPTALANVRQFYNLLSPKMSIIGCGGVLTGEDAFHHLLAGASAVSVGTSLMVNGPEIFKSLQQELSEIMIKKKYSKIEDYHGKLKTFF